MFTFLFHPHSAIHKLSGMFSSAVCFLFSVPSCYHTRSDLLTSICDGALRVRMNPVWSLFAWKCLNRHFQGLSEY